MLFGWVMITVTVTKQFHRLHRLCYAIIMEIYNCFKPDVPVVPTVAFSSNSYVLTVGKAQTGIVGRVSATADNGEAVTYLLRTDDGK